jgi:hypothetical protein
VTLLEAEDTAKALRDEAKRGWPDKADLLNTAAEAIEWLLEQLTDVEGQIEYLEQFEP